MPQPVEVQWLGSAVMASRFAWWHLRTWSGQYYFVHPDGWFEELEPWELVAIEFAFATEPAMAVYVDAVSHMMTPSQEWPPVWNADLQIWQTSREEPGRGSTVCGQGAEAEATESGLKGSVCVCACFCVSVCVCLYAHVPHGFCL